VNARRSKKKFQQRVAELTKQELNEPERWHYMSFADKVFRGVVIMLGHGVTDCVSRTHRMGINPGGEVLCVPMPDEILAQVPEADRLRLLSKADVQRIWPDAKTLREHEAERPTSEPS
jgi:hypothetical protein